MSDPNKKEQPHPIPADDPEWEQEKPIWDACENGEVSDDDFVSLNEFKALIDELVEDEEVTSDQHG